ncbi:MAG: tetratricopeptide repeat protein [candidate division Zixibacteria bacterium]|nr:tetratricopeptide repeat protein [candidate division Zixibacteria bacterium]
MKKIFCLLTILLIILALSLGCSSKAVKHRITEVKADPNQLKARTFLLDYKAEQIDQRAFHYYSNGLIYEGMGDLPAAAENYEDALAYYPESYQIAYSLAEIYYRMYQPEKALRVLEKMIPRDVEVFRLSAACFRMLNDYISAQKSYHNIIKLDPDNIEAYTFLSDIYRARNHLDSTIWAFENMARIRSDDPRIWHQLGRFQTQKKDYENAKESFRKSLELDHSQENFLSYIGLGELYEITDRVDTAETIYKEGLEVDPTNPLILRLLISLNINRDSLTRALPYSRQLVAVAPENYPEKRRLGAIYYRLDSLDKADTIFTELVESGDVYGMNHFYLGLIDTRLGNIEDARDEFELLTQLEDSLYIGWINLGLAYRNLDQPEKEIETYKKGLNALQSEEGVDNILFALGSAYERLKNYEEAKATFELLLEHFPDNAQALNYLGYMLADQNLELDYAKELISRAIELIPENAAFLDSYGWVNFRQGNLDEALKYLKRAVELDSDPIIFDHLGDAYKAKGKNKQAREWWQKALELDPENTAIKEKLGF